MNEEVVPERPGSAVETPAPEVLATPSAPTAPAAPTLVEKADDLEAIKKAVDDAAAIGGGLWLSQLDAEERQLDRLLEKEIGMRHRARGDNGALGIDIEHRTGWYCRTPEIAASEIQNTSGAGDSFRGAPLYALLSAKDRGPEALPRALLFATDVATERCRHFKIVEACTAIATKFGGRYLVDGRERSSKNWPNSAENWIKDDAARED